MCACIRALPCLPSVCRLLRLFNAVMVDCIRLFALSAVALSVRAACLICCHGVGFSCLAAVLVSCRAVAALWRYAVIRVLKRFKALVFFTSHSINRAYSSDSSGILAHFTACKTSVAQLADHEKPQETRILASYRGDSVKNQR